MISARFKAITAHSKQIRTEALVAAALAVQRRAAEKAKKRLQDYPPPIPSSKYERTFKLKNSWDIGVNLSASGLITVLSNSAEYSGFVHGDNSGQGQVSIHRGRWPLLRDALDRPGYISDLRIMVRGLIV